ncbi:hypothetical protein BJX70DRAFT_359833 [Aspergillus crustosus]
MQSDINSEPYLFILQRSAITTRLWDLGCVEEGQPCDLNGSMAQSTNPCSDRNNYSP